MPAIPGDPGVGPAGTTPQVIYWRYGAPDADDPDAPIGGVAVVQRYTPSGPVMDVGTWEDPGGQWDYAPDEILRWAPLAVLGGFPVRPARLITQASQVVRWGAGRRPVPDAPPRVLAYVAAPARLVFAQVP